MELSPTAWAVLKNSTTTELQTTLAYTAPFLTFGWYLAASLYGAITLQYLDATALSKKRRQACLSDALLSVLFVIESGTIIFYILQSFNDDRGDSQVITSLNVYALSHSLIYLFLAIVLASAEKHLWYTHSGVWIFTIIWDVTTSVATLNSHGDDLDPLSFSFLERSQLCFRFVRGVLILHLLASFLLLCIRPSPVAEVNEKSSLLVVQEGNESTEAAAQRKTNGVAIPPAAADGEVEAITKDTDDAFASAEEELQDQIKSLKDRLKENGDFITYMKSYKIFLSLMIWPSNKPMLKLQMIGVALCILAERALVALKPLAVGALTNYLTSRQEKEAFMALAFYGFFRWLDSPAGLHGLRALLWLSVENQAHISLDTAAYDHIMNLSKDFHDAKQSGELYAAFSHGGSVVSLLESMLYNFLPRVADLLVGAFYLYFTFDAYLVLLAVATAVIYLSVAIGGNTHQQNLLRRRNTADTQRYEIMYDTIGNWATVVYFNQLSHASKVYRDCVELVYDAFGQLSMYYFKGSALESLILTLSVLAAYCYAIWNILYGGKDLGSFIALQLYWSAFMAQLPRIPEFQRELLYELVNAEELLRLFNTKPSVLDGPHQLELKAGNVEFDQVGFSYSSSSGRQIIRDLTLRARPGETIALVGETGGGKSTILKLLFRFYDISEGTIKIDGQDIRQVTLKSLRDVIGIVPQDPTLFNTTIMENVRYARLDASDDEVKAACRAAAIHDKVMTFEHGYATQVGERGIKLSGGELQRIAIARAILKDSKIILLDEATSSVDTETEAKIHQALDHLIRGRTTFVVAHRLSTIRNADRIVVIHEGAILEQGTMQQLLKMRGKFFDLWNKQINQPERPESVETNAKPS